MRLLCANGPPPQLPVTSKNNPLNGTGYVDRWYELGQESKLWATVVASLWPKYPTCAEEVGGLRSLLVRYGQVISTLCLCAEAGSHLPGQYTQARKEAFEGHVQGVADAYPVPPKPNKPVTARKVCVVVQQLLFFTKFVRVGLTLAGRAKAELARPAF
jgi:hypothetical protein